MSTLNELTICSVSFRNADHLKLNWEITRRLNSNPDRIKWIVAENTPKDLPDTASLWDDKRFTVVPGVEPQPKVMYQHTMALGRALAKANTRYVLVLDPDFYIIRKEWVDELINHIQSQSLSFIGTTWNPKYSDKYRHFPTVHCFLADTHRIGLDELDFRPIIQNSNDGNLADKITISWRDAVSNRWARLIAQLPGIRDRVRIHYDTGGRLYYKFAGSAAHRYECFTPVFRNETGKRHRLSWRGRLGEFLLPDELCRLPKNKKSYRSTGFAEDNLWAAVPSQWDEFYWKDAPVGFHVRRNAQKQNRSDMDELEILKDRLHVLGLY